LKRVIINIAILVSSITTANSQTTVQTYASSLNELPQGLINSVVNQGTAISSSVLKNTFLVYPGNNEQIDIGNVVFFYGYNNSIKKYYDGLVGTEEDQEVIETDLILDVNGNLQYTSDGDILSSKITYMNKISLLGKLNIMPGNTTIAIRYETFHQINIFFYNYNSSGMLLSCFLAACIEKEGNPTNIPMMKATINADKTISVFTNGDFMIDQKFQLLSDGHFHIVYEQVTEYEN